MSVEKQDFPAIIRNLSPGTVLPVKYKIRSEAVTVGGVESRRQCTAGVVRKHRRNVMHNILLKIGCYYLVNRSCLQSGRTLLTDLYGGSD